MFVDNVDEAEWRKLGTEFERAFLGAPAYHPRVLLGRMAIWIYDKHTLLAKAESRTSGSNALFVVNRLATSRPQYPMAFL